MNPRITRFARAITAVVILWVPVAAWPAPPQPQKDAVAEQNDGKSDTRKKQRDESIKVMRERAAQTKVEVIGGENRRTAELHPTPFLYFTNEPHRIVGGSLWGWSVGGRPVALCKVEQYDRGRVDQTWLYCLTSLTGEKIDVTWRDGESWSAKTAGVEVRDFPDSPSVADDERNRLRQMKELSQRFSAMDFEPNGPGSTQFRLLTQPLWRYSSVDTGIIDGAVFATEGAAAVYLIELHQDRDKRRRWRYAVTAMSAWAVSIKLDGKEVWKKPFTAGPAPYDNWIFRWELPDTADK
jgi:hypothetical protein